MLIYEQIKDGDYCTCENSITEDMVDIAFCDTKCTRDPTALCGGLGHASVYSSKNIASLMMYPIALNMYFIPFCVSLQGRVAK